MKKTEEISTQLNNLFPSQKFAVLSSNNKGQPYSNLVAFASTDDLKTLYFATMRATRKYANISSDSRVAVMIDSRSNKSSDLSEAVAVTALGRAEESGADERQSILDIYLAKHPELKEFVSSPACALFKVAVKTYYIVNKFQNVQELSIES